MHSPLFSPSGTRFFVSEGLAVTGNHVARFKLAYALLAVLHAVQRQFYILHATNGLAKTACAHVGL